MFKLNCIDSLANKHASWFKPRPHQ